MSKQPSILLNRALQGFALHNKSSFDIDTFLAKNLKTIRILKMIPSKILKKSNSKFEQ